MLLSRLEIEGFRSFSIPQAFQFPTGEGLYFVTGRNEVEPELGANGAGKSSILEALTWCLFGKTTRGLKGASIENPQAKWTRVEVLAMTGKGGEWLIRRTRKPNTLTLNGDDITQEDLETQLGFDYSTFLNSVVMGQFGSYFLDLQPAKKLELLTKALGLEVWQEAAKKASERAGAKEGEAVALDLELARLDGKIENAKQQVAHLKKAHDRWQETHEVEREGLEEEIEGLREAVDRDEQAAKDLAAELEDLEADAEETTNQAQALAEELDEACRDRREMQRACEQDLARVEKAVTKLKDLSTCPTCKQSVPEGHRRTITKSMRGKAAKLKVKARRLESDREADSLRQRVKEWEAEVDEEAALVSDCAEKLKKADRRLVDSRASLKAAQRSLEAHKADDPYIDQLVQARKSRKALEQDRKVLSKAKRCLAQEAAHIAYWREGFKDLRLWVIDRALAELEHETNAALDALGLKGWRIAMEVERETQRGSTVKAFTATVQAPGERPVPYEAFSGGEVQRLRLASAVGIANLIANRQPHLPQLEAYDEPTAHLSDEGVQDVVQFLRDRALQAGKPILLIDHRSIDSGSFDGVTTVVKDAAGSRIE